MKIKKIVALATFLTILSINTGCSQGSLGGLNSGSSNSGPGALGGITGGSLGNLLEGVFSSSNITVQSMEGDWTATGPAVCFQTDNFLKKAGGVAVATAIESKLQPYYEQFGLTGSKLTVNADGTFTLNLKALKLSGNITPKSGAAQGVFDFNFSILGQRLAGVPAYVQKTSQSMDVMFDAKKLMTLLQTISQFSGSNMASMITDVIGSYDGLCVGFKFHGGKAGSNSNGLGGLLDMLGGGSNSTNNNNGNVNRGSSNSTNSGSPLQGGKLKK